MPSVTEPFVAFDPPPQMDEPDGDALIERWLGDFEHYRACNRCEEPATRIVILAELYDVDDPRNALALTVVCVCDLCCKAIKQPFYAEVPQS
jgi:hypothetical protein